MIIGTAGHIDHGKTSLVRALTGVETDRLKEEKARGISIELGFAYWPQLDGRIVGFVDVPGHEALVHNMLAGATGIDMVLLVVAADDGVMPQTREHLAIMNLLGLTRGVVALNKCDRVDQSQRLRAETGARGALAGTGLAHAPIIPVSAVTGEGLDQLKTALLEHSQAPRLALQEGLFRLAIDRSFTLKGHGTAVTGMVLSGSVKVGDDVTLSPLGLTARVRSMHAQNQPATSGVAGQRCALVLAGSGIEKDAIHRGDMVVTAELHAPTARFDAELRVLASEPKAIGTWFPVKVHHGASETPGRIVPLDPEKLAPGQTGKVQIVLERPIAACNTDRFILRDTASSRTIGGGSVLDVRAPERRRRTPGRLAVLNALGGAEQAVAAVASRLGGPSAWVNLSHLLRDRAQPPIAARALAERIGAVTVDTADGVIAFDAAKWRSLIAVIGGQLDRTHTERPDLPGLARERLRLALSIRPPIAVFNAVLERLTRDGHIAVDRSWVRRPSHQVRFSEQEEALWQNIWPRLIREPYKPPRVRDIAKEMDIDEALVRRLARMAARRGDVDEVAHDHFFARSVVEHMASIAQDCATKAPEGVFTAADFRDRLDNGRKVAIQILEFFDKHGFTIRRQDLRRINPHRVDLFSSKGMADADLVQRDGGVPLPVGRPDFKSGWGRQTVSGGFDSHSPPPLTIENIG